MPRVSVIVAARDAASTLPAALRSVAAQTYRDWEVVLVDDGSTDATAQVAGTFDGALRLLRNPRPVGPGAGRNQAAAQASGELLAILDADDLWKPSYLERQVELYDRAGGAGARVGLVACDAELLGPSGALGETFLDRVGRPTRLTLTELLRENVVYTSAVVPRNVFRQLGGYDPTLVPSEDYDLWLRIIHHGYHAILNPEVLATYRLRADALSADTVRAATSAFRVYEAALRRGGLTQREHRLARRQRRLQRAVAARAGIAAGRARGDRTLARRLRTLPLSALVAVEHPERWAAWMKHGGPRDPGPARHA